MIILPISQTPVGQQIQSVLVRVALAAHEDEVLQGVGQAFVVLGLGGQAEGAEDSGGVSLGEDNRETCPLGPDN